MDDFLDDILPEVQAPARAKFQPKAKTRSKKGSSISILSVSPVASKEQPSTSVQVDSESNQSVERNDIDGKLLVDANNVVGSTITGNSEISLSKLSGDGNLNTGTSLGIITPEDAIDQSTVATNQPGETPTTDACTKQMEEKMSTFPDVDIASASPFRPCCAQTAQDLSMPSMDHDTGHYKETLVSNIGDLQIDLEEGADDYQAVHFMSEADTASGKRAVKYQPKSRSQSSRKIDSNHISDASNTSLGIQHMNEEDSTCADDNEYYVETTLFDQSDDTVPEDIDSWGAPKLPEEGGEHGNFSHESVDGLAPSEIEANENEYVFADGVHHETQYNGSSHTEALNEPTNRDESIDDDYSVEETLKKKRQTKDKEVAGENDKPTRKRRKQSKAPDGSTEKPSKKKFPHATRRKRSVNKSLLEAPEEEIDLQRVPIKDLIILAEYRERQGKKAGTVQPPSTNERVDDMIPEDHLYDDDDETYGYNQDAGSFDNPNIAKILTDSRYFNYQSHTKRKKARWSKQETELFYQGVHQFGSDLSMIAQLFPGRSRNQIKLKFKNEERQQPMRLNDALSSRANDHSQFELVIKRLQEERAAREAEEQDQMSDEDNLIDPTGEEEGPNEEAAETHEVGAKSEEQNEDVSPADQEPNRAQVASPVKSYDSEDDFDWSTYQSEI